MPLDVRHVLRGARHEPIGATKALQAGRRVLVLPAGVIAAVAADDLKDVGVAAVRLAIGEVGWLPPQ